jgi:hypothetical protein
MGPQEVEVGTQGFIFQGGHIPIVIRSINRGLFQVVSKTYVHGIMYGGMIDSTRQFKMIDLK